MTNFDKVLMSLSEGYNSVRIETSQWQASTGKKMPGAQNKGMWIFQKDKNTDMDPKDEGETYIVCKGTKLYADAKKEAIAWAKSKGYGVIYLSP